VCASVELVTDRAPLVVLQGADEFECRRIQEAYPSAKIAASEDALADAVSACELSDALLIIDPACLPVRGDELVALVGHYSAQPRVSHHLVALESGVAGTKERVGFDSSGQVRRIHRHYVPVTWPFLTGVAATLLPVGAGVLADGLIPPSLAAFRQLLVAQGVPNRDVPLQGEAFDLHEETGLLAANEHCIRRAFSDADSAPGSPICVGDGHRVHDAARIAGPVIVQAGARIAENALIVGPAVIGRGASIGAGAVVAQAIIGSDCTVPEGQVIRNRVWHDAVVEADGDYAPAPYARRVRGPAEMDAVDEVALPNSHANLGAVERFCKRALDVTVATVSLVVFSPVMALAATAVWLENRRPIFYGDEREGLGGRVFRCWKFRTMRVGAHAAQTDLKTLDKMDGPHFKLDHDPRVTRVGRVLRALNLDELPQLFNVVTGEMSLVGPRPSPFRENQVCVPWREARLSVQPGITGFWQVCRHDRARGDFHQWIEYDLLYVQHISFWLDLKIIASTLLTLGGKAGHVSPSSLVPSITAGGQTNAASLHVPQSAPRTERVA
jgi:lipopolysaccharide/colanic/teichoic acid biosynthesis glycosyltransferase